MYWVDISAEAENQTVWELEENLEIIHSNIYVSKMKVTERLNTLSNVIASW